MTTRSLTVDIPEPLFEQLVALAQATSRSENGVALEALDRYVNSANWQIQDIEQAIAEADAGLFATDEEVRSVFAKYGA